MGAGFPAYAVPPFTDNLGRYYLNVMEDRVRRCLNDVQLTVDSTSGQESTTVAPVLPTQLYSTTDIDAALNKSMLEAFMEMEASHDDLFASVMYITISPNVTQYNLPFGLLQLRQLRLKPDTLSLTQARPEDWKPMIYYDEDLVQGIQNQFGGRTYRRVGEQIWLNLLPNVGNTNGIMVDAVVLPPELSSPGDVVESPFARLIQNFMIYDAAVNLGESREYEIPQEVRDQRERAHVMMIMASDNALKPPSVQLYSTRLVKQTYSGR